MRTTPRTLEQLHGRRTTYEVVAVLPIGTHERLGFTSRPSRATLLRMAREASELILPHLTNDDTITYSAAGGLRIGPVVVRKSGRTERECAVEEVR